MTKLATQLVCVVCWHHCQDKGENMAKRFVSSHESKSEANNALHETVAALQSQGLVKEYGAKVESRGGSHYVVLVERKK